MEMHKRIASVTPVPLGDETTTDLIQGATVIPVSNSGDFAEDGGWVRIGAEVYAYTAVEEGEDDDAPEPSVTIDSPGLLEDAPAGTAVDVWDADALDGEGAVVVDYLADVTDDTDGSPGVAYMQHDLVSYLPEGLPSGVGESVTVTVDDVGDWYVTDIHGRVVEPDLEPKPKRELRGVPMYVYGDSYTQLDPPEATPGPTIARRHRMQTAINYGISGSTFAHMFTRIEQTWVPNTRGLIVIGDGTINNMQVWPATNPGYNTSREAFRAILAHLSDRAVLNATDRDALRFGPGWTETVDGMTGSAGAYVDVAWDSGECDVFCELTTGSGGGVIEFADQSGNVVASLDTDGYAADVIGVCVIPSQGAGVHTVRGTVDSGTVTIRKVGARATTPPLIVWDKAGPILWLGDSFGKATLRAFQRREIQAVEAFDNAFVSDNDVARWNKNRAKFLTSDLAHRNDDGNAFATDTMDAALRANINGFIQGLNAIEHHTADEPYTEPSASYAGPGATVPDTPTLTAVTASQIKLSWTRPADGGATLTEYFIQHRTTAGPGTWTEIATIDDPGDLAHNVTSGLTPATSYDFRIRAVNAVGNGSFSTPQTAVAGDAATVLSADDFNETDDPFTLGTADTGGAWSAGNGIFGISSNGAKCFGGKTTPANFCFATVSDGEASGYVEATIRKLDTVAGGIVMNANAAASTQAWVLYAYAGQYLLRAQFAANSFAAIAAYPIVPQDGDRIGLYHDGLDITAVINDEVQATYTGVSELTGTRHGLFCFSNGEWDDYQHTNFNPLV